MATHSSVLAWRIPETGEPGGLPSMRSHRLGHDWSDLAAAVPLAQYNGKDDESHLVGWNTNAPQKPTTSVWGEGGNALSLCRLGDGNRVHTKLSLQIEKKIFLFRDTQMELYDVWNFLQNNPPVKGMSSNYWWSKIGLESITNLNYGFMWVYYTDFSTFVYVGNFLK